jgi:N6-adenosine-specific RNA methylase IME4
VSKGQQLAPRSALDTFAAMIRAGGEVPIGKFTFTKSGLLIKGKPDLDEYAAAGVFIDWSLEGSPWWKSDWLAYGETRGDWQERLAQAVEKTGLSEKTLLNMKRVAEQVPPSRRRADVSFGVHAVVAPLREKDQVELLERAATEGLGVREVAHLIRTRKRQHVIAGRAELKGKYRIVYADPDWEYDYKKYHGAAERHYETSPIEEIAKLMESIVAAHAMRDSALLMWATAPILLQNPGPREVIERCGFAYKQNIVWDKVDGVSGHYHHGNHEHLLICTRGSCTPDEDANWLDSVQAFKRPRNHEHSSKPKEFRQIIEKVWIFGPEVEVFARERVDGWDVMGDDPRLFTEGATK